MEKESKSAAALADIIREHLDEPELRLAVYFDKVESWRAVVYTSKERDAKQVRVNACVRELRDRFELDA